MAWQGCANNKGTQVQALLVLSRFRFYQKICGADTAPHGAANERGELLSHLHLKHPWNARRANWYLIEIKEPLVQLLIDFEHMRSGSTCGMLIPARSILPVCIENIENPCFITLKTCFSIFFEVFKSGGIFRHVLAGYLLSVYFALPKISTRHA